MAQVQLFKKESDGIESRKSQFLSWLELSQSIFLLSEDVYTFLQDWINQQTSFTPRQDVDNFSSNIQQIIEDEDLKQEIVEKTSKKDFSWMSILQKSFEYISVIDDTIWQWQETKQKLQAERNKQKQIANMKQKEELEKQDELNNLEQMLDNL